MEEISTHIRKKVKRTFSVAASVLMERAVLATPKLLLGANATAGAAKRRVARASFMMSGWIRFPGILFYVFVYHTGKEYFPGEKLPKEEFYILCTYVDTIVSTFRFRTSTTFLQTYVIFFT